MNETNQTEFHGFAKVEVMGHQSHTGYVETQTFGAAVLFRIDTPALAEIEETLTGWEWVGDTRCPPGTVVKRAAIPASTVLVGAASIYRIVPCDEEAAVAVIRATSRRPLFVVKMGEAKALPPAETRDDPFDDIDDEGEDAALHRGE